MQKLAFLAVLAFAPAAFASDWTLDAAHTDVGFTVKHMMITDVRGAFDKSDANIVLDDKDLTKSKVEVTIDVASVNTKVQKRDDHLRSPDFFDAAKHPKMTFKSTKVEKGSKPNTFKVTGDLTIRGVTKPVVLNVEYTPEVVAGGKPVRGLTATTKINRKDFGLNWNKTIEAGGVMVGDEVAITVEAELHKKEPSTAAK